MSNEPSDARPLRLSEVPAWDLETDVVIVGYGSAGASAAIGACEAGAEVHVFEVASGPGGTSAMAGGDIYLGGNGGTPPQRENGFHDETEDFFRYMMMASGPDPDEARVRLYADNALDHFDWLEEQGVRFTPGGIRKGASGHDICFVHPKGNDDFPLSGEGVLIELVQAPADVIEELSR